jgi:hypothetical protein
MDNRNYVNSEYYAKLLREKMKRDNKVAKMQNRILHDKTSMTCSSPPCAQQNKSLIPKKVKKLSTPEKLPKHAAARKSECQYSNLVKTKQLSSSDNDLLSEIDKSLSGIAKGFVYKNGN